MALTVQSRLGRGRTVETLAATLEVGSERLDVVVKRPRAELAGNQAFVQALLGWAEAQAELDHEGLVAVLESGRSSEGAYVIQEHVDGVSLAAILSTLRRRRRTLSPAHAVMIARQVAEALAYLAEHGRRGHGDLDPGEILVSYRGEIRTTDARLSDLRVHVGADLLDDASDAAPYRAPEVKGTSGGPEADVYALALVLLEMLIGHPVWTAETMTVADAVAALTDFTHIGQASPALTKDLLGVLGAALADDPSARPSAASVKASLQDIQATHGLADDELGLGVFVEAILPPPKEEADAATQLMTPEQVEALQRKREASADWDAASVLISPEIEARAAADLAQARRASSKGASKPLGEVAAAEASPIPPTPSQALVAASVPLERASKTQLEQAAKAVRQAADAERAAEARRASSSSGLPPPPPPPEIDEGPLANLMARLDARSGGKAQLALGVGLAVALLVLLALVLGGPDVRAVKLRATSEPSDARLFVDGAEVGRTPFEDVVQTADEQVGLRFELEGYESHEVTIGTAAGEVRYEARLVAAAED